MLRRRRGDRRLEDALVDMLLGDEDWTFRYLLSDVIAKESIGDPVIAEIRTRISDTKTAGRYLQFCPRRKASLAFDLSLLRQVLTEGTEEDQWCAMDGIASMECKENRRALMDVVRNRTGHPMVPERAMEMLHTQRCAETLHFAIEKMQDPEPAMRFWALYTAWQVSQWTPRYKEIAIPAVTRLLEDHTMVQGWWTVAQEAKATRAYLMRDEEALQKEIERIQADPQSAAEDKRWAECFDTKMPDPSSASPESR